MVLCLVNGGFSSGGKLYPESVRRFSLRQQYYSSAAYHSLRQFFSNNLPSKRTLQLWYGSLQVSPGICDSALSILRERAESYMKENGHQLNLALMHDEMSIRKEICWDSGKRSFIGFSTITNSSGHGTNEPLKVAKDALVYMAVGPNFKVPVAYHLLNGLEAVDRAALTLEVIKRIEDIGARVFSLTGDGIIFNITIGEILGANFEENKPYFFSPTHPDRKIYMILDPPHMLKLVRKHMFQDKIYHGEKLVDCEYLRILVAKQSLGNFNLNNKLTERHINWHQMPMNVRLAAETISKSVADTIKQLRNDGYLEFKNSEGTDEFLRYFNDAFDILNVDEKTTGVNIFKQPICGETEEEIFSFIERFQQYINELEHEMKTKKIPVLKSKSLERGFFGFFHNFTSLKGIYEDLVKNGPLEVFYPFQFCQDHLENFFSLIR